MATKFWFVEALRQRHTGDLDLDTDALSMYLLAAPSVWTPDDTETSLTTARGDEIGVGGYTPESLSTSITKDTGGVNVVVSSPVAFGNLSSGATVVAALIGKPSTGLPVAYIEFDSPKSTTGGPFNVELDANDLRIDTEDGTSFWFVDATEGMADGSLVMDTDTITAYLLGPPSVWTPDKTQTSLTTARGDELTGYTPLTITTTIVSDINSSDVRVTPKPLVFVNVNTGQTVHAVLLGKSGSGTPVSYHKLNEAKATTGQNVEITFDNADLISKNE